MTTYSPLALRPATLSAFTAALIPAVLDAERPNFDGQSVLGALITDLESGAVWRVTAEPPYGTPGDYGLARMVTAEAGTRAQRKALPTPTVIAKWEETDTGLSLTYFPGKGWRTGSGADPDYVAPVKIPDTGGY